MKDLVILRGWALKTLEALKSQGLDLKCEGQPHWHHRSSLQSQCYWATLGRCPWNTKTLVRLQPGFLRALLSERQNKKSLLPFKKVRSTKNKAQEIKHHELRYLSHGLFKVSKFSSSTILLIFLTTCKQGNKSQRRSLDGLGTTERAIVSYYFITVWSKCLHLNKVS